MPELIIAISSRVDCQSLLLQKDIARAFCFLLELFSTLFLIGIYSKLLHLNIICLKPFSPHRRLLLEDATFCARATRLALIIENGLYFIFRNPYLSYILQTLYVVESGVEGLLQK